MAVLSVSSLVSFNFHLWSMKIHPFHCVFNGIFDPVTKWVCFVRHVIAKMWYYPLAWRIWKMIQLKPCKSQNTLKEAIGWEWTTYNPTWFRKFSLIHVVNSYLKKVQVYTFWWFAIIGFFSQIYNGEIWASWAGLEQKMLRAPFVVNTLTSSCWTGNRSGDKKN